MREIKFRVWNKEKERMNHKFQRDLFLDESEHGSFEMKEHPNFVLMQYTGLKDKSGKEIYEGDVLKITDTFHTYNMPVEWCADAWTLKEDGTYGTLAEWARDSEVIGNIYENPELLNV